VGRALILAAGVAGAHRDHRAAGGAPGGAPGGRVLDDQRLARRDAELRARREVAVGRGLGARHVLGAQPDRERVGRPSSPSMWPASARELPVTSARASAGEPRDRGPGAGQDRDAALGEQARLSAATSAISAIAIPAQLTG
jgi:hypothetical protein